MNYAQTTEYDTKSFSDFNLFDGIGANFKKHLDAHLDQGNIEDNKTDSLFVESVVVHNEIDLEEEMNKIRDDDEGAFKILSMSFYDKKTRGPAKPICHSPNRLDESNRVFTLRHKTKTPKNIDIPPKTGSHPSLTPLASEMCNGSQIRDKKLVSPKVGIKPEMKLYAIKQRISQLEIPPQLSPQKPNYQLSLLVSPNDKAHTQPSLKDLGKQEKDLMKPQKPFSPSKESLSRELSVEKKPSILDLKISALVKSKTPTYAVKKSSSKERIFASPPRITFNVSPKGFRFHPKVDSSSLEKTKNSREPSETKMPQAASRKNDQEESPLRSPSPAFSLNKTVLARRFDLQRVSLNNIHAPSKERDASGKESKTPSRVLQKANEAVMQQPAQPQPPLQIQPMKVEFPKGIRSNQPTQSYYANGSRRGSNFEHKNSKLLLNQKLRINTEENSSLKISIRDISDSSIYLTGSRSVKGKMKMLDFSSVKQRDIAAFSSSKDMFDPTKLSFKSQSKSKVREAKDKPKEVETSSKQKNPVLPLQSRTFDI